MLLKPIRPETIPFGKHKGKRLEKVVIFYPDFLYWMESVGFNGYPDVCSALNEFVDAFDAHPFKNAVCSGKVEGVPCTRPVSQFSIYKNTAVPMFWCEKCDPCQYGTSSEKLTIGSNYYDALDHFMGVGARMTGMRRAINDIAKAKGLERKTEQAIINFLKPA
jgi:hypothetical protein